MRRFGTGDGRVTTSELRRLLIERAAKRETISYGEVAEAFGERWQQGFGASLKKALNELGAQNKVRGEPLLMALVVNRSTQEPGEGFYQEIGEGGADPATRASLLDRELDRIQAWKWR